MRSELVHVGFVVTPPHATELLCREQARACCGQGEKSGERGRARAAGIRDARARPVRARLHSALRPNPHVEVCMHLFVPHCHSVCADASLA